LLINESTVDVTHMHNKSRMY